MRLRNLLFVFLAFAGVVLFGGKSFAHQTGASWEKVVNGYKVDIGYDPTTFFAGESQRFDFNAYSEGTNDPVDFSDVWVRISQGEQTVFAGGIHKPEFGLAGMVFVFPKAGDYTLSARFENKDKNFVESSQNITVAPPQDGSGGQAKSGLPVLPITLSVLAGLVIGAGAALLLKKKPKIQP